MAAGSVCGLLLATKSRHMPARERENDVSGRFTNDPGRDSPTAWLPPLVFSSAYTSKAASGADDRAFRGWTGAPPLFTLHSAPPSGDDNCAPNCALFIPFSGGLSLHSDPCGKAEMLKTWSQVVLLNLALTAAGLRAWLSPWPALGEAALLDLVRATDPFMYALFAGVYIAAPGLAVLIVSLVTLSIWLLWPVRSMATRSGTLARIRLRAGRCGGNRGGSGSARRPPGRRCASGGRGCRRGGRPAGCPGCGTRRRARTSAMGVEMGSIRLTNVVEAAIRVWRPRPVELTPELCTAAWT